jgi:hypothetical protein
MEQPKTRKPTPGIHDEDLDLGHVLHHYNAPKLGAHPFVNETLTPKPKLAGRFKTIQSLPSGVARKSK